MVRWPLWLALAFTFACNSETGDGDAGQPADAGNSNDAGAQTDGGPIDAGTLADAGVLKDAGPSTDGGQGGDAGPAPDGGPHGGPVSTDGGLPFVIDGGQLAKLDFGLVGDTRPPIYDDTANYPGGIIGTIFASLASASPPIAFVVSTGDYMFADPLFGQSVPQADLYVDAGHFFPGPVYPAMGNHECNIALSGGNCFGQDTTDPNFKAYLTTILPGFDLPSTSAYFAVIYGSSDPTNPWTAKFIFTAPNAWDDGQNSWFADALALPSTYTFVVRHEPTSDSGGAAGVAPTDTLLQTNAFTLKLTGHSHEYSYEPDNQEVINGLGGAALNTGYSGTFGYVICRQRTDNAIQCSLYDEDTNLLSTQPNSTFAVTAAGASTPAQ